MRLIGNPNQMPSGATPPSGAFTRPRFCAVIPNRTTDPEGFIETGVTFPGTDEPVLVSVAAVREMARIIDMVPREEVEELTENFAADYAELSADIEELGGKVEEARELEQARTLVAKADKEIS